MVGTRARGRCSRRSLRRHCRREGIAWNILIEVLGIVVGLREEVCEVDPQA